MEGELEVVGGSRGEERRGEERRGEETDLQAHSCTIKAF